MILIRKIIASLFILLFAGASGQNRISYFSAIPLTDSVRFTVQVSAGIGCPGFQVLKGSDSVNLNQVWTYPGLCGNTSYAETYHYTDYSPNKLTPNYYRILIPPNNYSEILKVDLATNFSNLLIFPQPAEDVLNIAISSKTSFNYELTVYDRFGRKKGFGSGNAFDKITLNVSDFEEGIYVFYIFDNNGNSYRGKFLKNVND